MHKKKNCMPKVSIVIPAFNASNFITETLKSVFRQTYKDYEVIVVDDGSTDDTKEVLDPFMDRIRYIYQSNSGGPAKPRNVGICNAKGKYISLHDSDDVMLPEKIERAVEFLEAQPSLGMVFTNFTKIKENGEKYQGTFLDGYEHFQGMAKRKIGENQYILSGKDVPMVRALREKKP